MTIERNPQGHTEGPWHVENDCDHFGNENWFVCHPATVCDATAVCSVENEANARLIASAPELLAALENLADFCEQVFVKPRENQELQDAIAAISKATRDNVGGV